MYSPILKDSLFTKQALGVKLLAFVLVVLSILACVSESKQGELYADCSITIFRLQGEVDPTWTTTVLEDHAYELSIRPEDTAYSLNEITVEVYEIGEGDRTPITHINVPGDDEEHLSLRFSGPSTQRIFIKL